MSVIRSNLIHWLQDKITIFHINMWNMKIRSVYDLIIIEQNIQIKSTRSLVNDTFSVCGRLQFVKTVQKFFRREQRTEFQNTIQKFILFHTTIRFCN